MLSTKILLSSTGKELMLPPSHPKVEEFMALTKAEETKGLYKNVHLIGFRKTGNIVSKKRTVL
jgi:hypothetical protein